MNVNVKKLFVIFNKLSFMLLEIWKFMLIPISDKYINTPHKSALRTSLGREDAEQKGQTENFSFSNTLIIVL